MTTFSTSLFASADALDRLARSTLTLGNVIHEYADAMRTGDTETIALKAKIASSVQAVWAQDLFAAKEILARVSGS